MLRNLLLILFCLFFSATAAAQLEKILHFDSHIIVNKDASIDVTENILVHTNEDKILHGIVRRLPMRFKDSDGTYHHSTYQIRQILMNNEHSAYHVERFHNTYAIYIGSLDVMLKAGNYQYTIQYHVAEGVNFLKDADELYWNITGNEWDFPILSLQALIQLPDGASILHAAGYTGPPGEKGQAFTVTQPATNQISFGTTQPLLPGEGLIAAVSWPTGIVQKPTLMQRVKSQFQTSGQFIMLEIESLVLGEGD
jgi:hypothetical protein